jgi:hypothetical protein
VLEFISQVLVEAFGSLFTDLLPHQPRSAARGLLLLLVSLGMAGSGLWLSAAVILDRPGWWWEPLAFVAWGLCIVILLGSLQAFGVISSKKH